MPLLIGSTTLACTLLSMALGQIAIGMEGVGVVLASLVLMSLQRECFRTRSRKWSAPDSRRQQDFAKSSISAFLRRTIRSPAMSLRSDTIRFFLLSCVRYPMRRAGGLRTDEAVAVEEARCSGFGIGAYRFRSGLRDRARPGV